MHKFKQRIMTAAAAATVAAGGLLVAATPAHAASSSCTAPFFHTGHKRTCYTGTVGANKSNHFIHITVDACSGSPWTVWDTVTGSTIANGEGDTSRNVFGLYGTSYKAKLKDACAYDSIRIDNN